MWTFEAPPLDYWKARYGFTPTQQWLDHVRLASIRLPNCSSSFVSSRGLVMTNHHCARECITAVSTPDSNFQEIGFVAKTQADERKCPGLYVDQLQGIEDVTPKIQKAITATTPAQQVSQRNAAIDSLEKACETGPDVQCQVITYHQGGAYSLYRFKRFSDLRLVMAPEEAISFYGGDPDNFTYPRYDLDLSLMRVYENGQPYQPKDYLKWSREGAKEGDPVFVTGNPGSTGRLLTVAQMEYLRDVQYPAQLSSYDRNLAVMEEMSKQDEETRRALENQIFSLKNSKKAVTGYLSGLQDSSVMAKKRAFERDFRRRVNADPKLKARYGASWDAIATAQRQLAGIAKQQRWYSFSGSPLLNVAGGLVRIPAQAKLPDSLRLPQYRAGGIDQIKASIAGPIETEPEAEKQMLQAWLTQASKDLPVNDPYLDGISGRPEPRGGCGGGDQRNEAGRFHGTGSAPGRRLGRGRQLQGSADRSGPEAQSDRHAGSAAGSPAQRRDQRQCGEGRPGHLCGLRPVTSARCHVQSANQRWRGEELSHERHHGSVQDQLLRTVCPIR